MDYLKLAQDLVGRTAAGDLDAEALIMQSDETMIRVNRGEVVEMSSARSKGVGVRVISSGRTGFAYTSDFDPSSLHTTADDAVALAASADPDEFRGLPETRDQGLVERDLGVYEPCLLYTSPSPRD